MNTIEIIVSNAQAAIIPAYWDAAPVIYIRHDERGTFLGWENRPDWVKNLRWGGPKEWAVGATHKIKVGSHPRHGDKFQTWTRVK